MRLRFVTSHGMDCMEANDTVYTVRLRFNLKMQSHSEKFHRVNGLYGMEFPLNHFNVLKNAFRDMKVP